MADVTQPPPDGPPSQPGRSQQGASPGGPGQWGTFPGAAAAPPWTPPAPKPGIVALRPLGVADILDGAIAAVRGNLRTMVGLSAAVLVVTTVVRALVSSRTAGAMPSGPATTPQEVVDALVRVLPLYALGSAAAWAGTTLLGGLLAAAVGRAVLGGRATPREAWAAVRPLWWQLLLVTLFAGLAVLACLLPAVVVTAAAAAAGAPAVLVLVCALVLGLAGVALAVWVWARLALAGPALVLESGGGARRVGAVTALRRSAALVRGAWWRTFALLLLVAVLATVGSGIVAAPFGFASSVLPGGGGGASGDGAALVVSSLGTLVGALLTTPFAAAAVTLVYVDRRIRSEGIGPELARAAGVGPDGAAPS